MTIFTKDELWRLEHDFGLPSDKLKKMLNTEEELRAEQERQIWAGHDKGTRETFETAEKKRLMNFYGTKAFTEEKLSAELNKVYELSQEEKEAIENRNFNEFLLNQETLTLIKAVIEEENIENHDKTQKVIVKNQFLMELWKKENFATQMFYYKLFLQLEKANWEQHKIEQFFKKLHQEMTWFLNKVIEVSRTIKHPHLRNKNDHSGGKKFRKVTEDMVLNIFQGPTMALSIASAIILSQIVAVLGVFLICALHNKIYERRKIELPNSILNDVTIKI